MSLPGGNCCIPRGRLRILLLMAGLATAGCHARGPSTFTVEITRVPPANPGGPAKLDYIQGRVRGTVAGEEIVLYARSGVWWVQPFTDRMYTKVQPDSTWMNATHLGTEYAALLVEPGYRPPTKAVSLPRVGHGVLAEALASGTPGPPLVTKVIHFSGYDWIARAAGSDRGGEPNAYDPANAWTDEKGYLHLRMEQNKGTWTCAEVRLTHSLGFGTYRFVVQDSAHLTPSAVLGMFTFDDLSTDEIRNELDIEMSRWGNAAGKNAQYVVQPYYVPENVARFEAPAGVLTHTFRWEPGMVTFRTVRGAEDGPGAKEVSEHVFTSGVPNSAGESVHIDLYDYHHSRNSNQQPSEVVIEKFEYLP